jgi:pimeloyl-ACP methyl ester carboxylesterase
MMSLSQQVAFAKARHCDGPQVQRTQSLLNSREPGRGYFEYRFHMNQPQTPTGPVVIFIPGGPGQTGFQTPLSYPDHFQIVRTDPRGLGCNADSRLTESDLTSEQTARDLLSLVRALGDKPYILHGVSYGTMVATIAAALVHEQGLPAPLAVVLEGTIGRAFKPGEYDQVYIQKWDELRQTLPLEVQEKLETTDENPLGVSGRSWAAWISGMLNYGHFADGSSLLGDQLKALEQSSGSEAEQNLLNRIQVMTRLAPDDRRFLHRLVTCQEIAHDMRDLQFDFDLVNGRLVANSERLCESLSFTRPFESKAWQIHSPIFYFSGEDDPATPTSQVQHHFENQMGPRFWVQVAGGGHAALSGSLMDCQHDLWDLVAQGRPEHLSEVLQTCQMPTTLKSR